MFANSNVFIFNVTPHYVTNISSVDISQNSHWRQNAGFSRTAVSCANKTRPFVCSLAALSVSTVERQNSDYLKWGCMRYLSVSAVAVHGRLAPVWCTDTKQCNTFLFIYSFIRDSAINIDNI